MLYLYKSWFTPFWHLVLALKFLRGHNFLCAASNELLNTHNILIDSKYDDGYPESFRYYKKYNTFLASRRVYEIDKSTIFWRLPFRPFASCHSPLALWHVRDCFLCNRWRGKRSRFSRRMRDPQFYASDRRLMTSQCRFTRALGE